MTASEAQSWFEVRRREVVAENPRYARALGLVGSTAAPAPCRHLGSATGATSRCPTCAGHVEVKLLTCAVHGSCTVAKKVEGHACCQGCPDREAAMPPPIHTRHLLYHLYPVRGNGAWQWNVKQLLHRINLFNGRRVVAIAVDPPTGRKPDPRGQGEPGSVRRRIPPTDSADTVKEAFCGHVREFIVVDNDPALREVKTFEPLFGHVSDLGDGHAVFYAHAKGVTYPPGHLMRRWAEMLYEVHLDYWPLVERTLADYPLAGAFRKVGRGWPAHQSRSEWHYSGSFLWANCQALFSRPNWREIERFWSGQEPWASLHFRKEEAGVLFHDGTVEAVQMYDAGYVRRVVEPAYAAWKVCHATDRGSAT